MGKPCKCSDSLGNTGTVACLSDVANTKKIFVLPTFNSLGVRNSFTTATVLDSTFLTARLNDTDVTKRWRPISDLENVTDVRAESTYETASSGRKSQVKDGTRSFSAELWGAERTNSQYLGVLKGMKCTDMSIYILDVNNNLIGAVPNTDGNFYPIRLDNNSYEAKLIKATDSTKQHINLVFDFHPNENDEDLNMIVEPEYTADFEGCNGLLDIYKTATSTGTASMVFQLYAIYGTAKTKQPMKGLLIGDFALYNVTDSLAVTILTLTESPDGTYTLTYAANTVSDVLRVTPTKNGYDFTNVVSATSIIV